MGFYKQILLPLAKPLGGIKTEMKGIVLKNIWFFVLLLGFYQNSKASDDFKEDSINVQQTVSRFYDWYLKSIKQENITDFQPKFVESDNGMTTLDLSAYLDNLRTNGFSDSLIIREKQSYSECIKNLETVRFDNFGKTTFTDLDDFEQTDCDFGNYYRWTGGQEPIDGIKIQDIEFISDDKAIVTIIYYETDSDDNQKHYWGENLLILIRLDDEWKIDDINSWKEK